MDTCRAGGEKGTPHTEGRIQSIRSKLLNALGGKTQQPIYNTITKENKPTALTEHPGAEVRPGNYCANDIHTHWPSWRISCADAFKAQKSTPRYMDWGISTTSMNIATTPKPMKNQRAGQTTQLRKMHTTRQGPKNAAAVSNTQKNASAAIYTQRMNTNNASEDITATR